MAAGDAVQLGAEYLIGIGGTYYLGYTVKGLTYTKDADESIHKDERGATDSILTQDPKQGLDLTLDIVGASTDFAPPDKNELVTVQGPDDTYSSGYRVVSASTSANEGVAQLSLSLILEDSMGMTYPDGTFVETDAWDISDDLNYTDTLEPNGSSDVVSVYGAGVLLTETTDWSYASATGVITINATYIGTIIVAPGDTLVLSICPNYGRTLTTTLTGLS